MISNGLQSIREKDWALAYISRGSAQYHSSQFLSLQQRLDGVFFYSFPGLPACAFVAWRSLSKWILIAGAVRGSAAAVAPGAPRTCSSMA